MGTRVFHKLKKQDGGGLPCQKRKKMSAKMGDKTHWSIAIIYMGDSVKLHFCPPSTKSLLYSTLIAKYITS
jgi:hypothetical protein